MKHSTNRLAYSFAVATLGVSAFAGDLLSPAFMFTVKNVDEGENEVENGKVLISGEGTLAKTGLGTWTLHNAMLFQPWSAGITVEEGAIALVGDGEGVTSQAGSIPETISDKALLWVDASDPIASHIVSGDGGVAQWYDRREGETPTPAYCRASAHTGHTSALPLKTKLDDVHDAIYFGGYGSGQTMEFLLPDGSRFNESSSGKGVRHVFAVHAPINSYGTIFGSLSSTRTPFRIDTTHSENIKNYYWESATTFPGMSNGRTYLNGERIDGTLTIVRKGLQLIEAERYFNHKNTVNGFFANTDPTGSGGDYLCEAIVFTNVLNETERLQVSDYLMRKWKLRSSECRLKVEVAENAAFSTSGDNGGDSTSGITFTGSGLVELSGLGGKDIFNPDSTAFDGKLSLGDCSAVLRSPATLNLETGGTLNVDNLAEGPVASFEESGGVTLRKTGKDAVRIASVPDGVTRLKIEEGSLAIVPAAPVENLTDRYTQIPIIDGGFESANADIATMDEGKGVLYAADMSKSENCRWTYTWNGEATCYIVDWHRWTGYDLGGTIKSQWSFTMPPPEGKCSLMIRPGSSLSKNAVALSKDAYQLEAGVYEIRFFMSGRQDETYLGQIFSARLIDSTTEETKADFGDVMFTDISGFKEFRLRTELAESGSYKFDLRSYGGRLGVILIDDLRLYKVAPSFANARKWKIPGGDFETDTLPLGKDIKRFCTDYTVDGWTFHQTSDWTAGKTPDVGITTLCATNTAADHGSGVYYNDSRRPATGSMELCFRNGNARATAIFTPPAGRWLVQAYVAQFGSYGTNPKLSASVKIGDSTIDLGTIGIKSRLMKTLSWPVSFEVDGAQEVSLMITSSGIANYYNTSGHGLLVDDVVLAGATDLNIMIDGDCEGYSTSLLNINSATFGGKSGQCQSRKPTAAPEAFGTTTIKGDYIRTLENLSAVYEDVFFPFAGRYRLSFYVHSRLNNKTNYGPNPVRVWIAENGITNEVGRVDTYNSEWVQRVFDFDIVSPGVKRLALQGCDNPENAQHLHEAHIDAISLHHIPAPAESRSLFPKDVKITVADGAVLAADFSGTNTVKGLKLGNREFRGVVRAADHPGYLQGEGVFNVVPDGTVVILR